jgi:hypothetical protein
LGVGAEVRRLNVIGVMASSWVATDRKIGHRRIAAQIGVKDGALAMLRASGQ